MSALFKLAKPGGLFTVPGVEGGVHGWPKAQKLDENGADDSAVTTQRPPLAPTRFEAELGTRSCTNGVDLEKLKRLYAETLHHGLGARKRLAFGSCGWGDADAAELATTLREVPHPEVMALDLSNNEALSNAGLAAIGAAIGDGALSSLRELDVCHCERVFDLTPVVSALPRRCRVTTTR